MKKIFLLTAIICSASIFGQTRFEISPSGFTDFIITEMPGNTMEDLYTKTIEWINRTYKNPDKVILSKIENDYIRIEGIKANMFCIHSSCQDGRYQIEISFKDEKYRFDPIKLEQNMPGWVTVDFNANRSFYFGDSGLKKKFQMYNSIPAYFNGLNDDLKNYIEIGVKTTNKSDW